ECEEGKSAGEQQGELHPQTLIAGGKADKGQQIGFSPSSSLAGPHTGGGRYLGKELSSGQTSHSCRAARRSAPAAPTITAPVQNPSKAGFHCCSSVLESGTLALRWLVPSITCSAFGSR